jgi:hypothetical protein
VLDPARNVEDWIAQMQRRRMEKESRDLQQEVEAGMTRWKEQREKAERERARQEEETRQARASRDLVKSILAVFFSVIAVSIIVSWAVRRRREQRWYCKGVAFMRSTDFTEAVECFSNAEQSWGFNAAHSTPAQLMKDIDRLSDIMTNLASAASKVGISLSLEQMHRLLAQMKSLYANKANYWFGTIRFKPDVRRQWESLWKALLDEREQIRQQLPKKPDGNLPPLNTETAMRISTLPDNDLETMLLKKADYTPEAVAFARQEIERRHKLRQR